MKWKTPLGILLIVLFAQSPALAPTHYSEYYACEAGQALPVVDHGKAWISIILVAAFIVVLTLFVVRLVTTPRAATSPTMPMAAPVSRALFFSLTSMIATLTVGDYVFVTLFGVSEARGIFQLIFLTVMDAVFLVGLLVWSAPWIFGRTVSWTQGLRVLAIPILLPTLWAALHHIGGRTYY